MDIREGRILSGVGGCYTVFSQGERHDCRARGRFRDQGVTPMAGDRVSFLPPGSGRDGYLLDILPRNNRLRRPAVSNIDRLVVVVSAGRPEPDLMLVDRLLVDARLVGAEPLLALNKADLDENRVAGIAAQYAMFPVLATSAYSGGGIKELAARLAGHTACFAGQSGVGKTSLINRLCPGAAQGEIGNLSERGGRGRHTTRRTELLPLPNGGWVVDTPGFSLLTSDPMEPGRLRSFYPEFEPLACRCRFDDCRHDREKNCAVREAAQSGMIHPQRYLRYTALLREMNEKWRDRYE